MLIVSDGIFEGSRGVRGPLTASLVGIVDKDGQ